MSAVMEHQGEQAGVVVAWPHKLDKRGHRVGAKPNARPWTPELAQALREVYRPGVPVRHQMDTLNEVIERLVGRPYQYGFLVGKLVKAGIAPGKKDVWPAHVCADVEDWVGRVPTKEALKRLNEKHGAASGYVYTLEALENQLVEMRIQVRRNTPDVLVTDLARELDVSPWFVANQAKLMDVKLRSWQSARWVPEARVEAVREAIRARITIPWDSITVKAAVRLVRIMSVHTFRTRYIKTGIVRSHNTGNAMVVCKADVDRLLAEGVKPTRSRKYGSKKKAVQP